MPIVNTVNPIYLRHILASTYITSVIQRYRMGASLPRISIKDLLKIEIPVPPMDVQNKLSMQLIEVDLKIKALRKELDSLPQIQTSLLVKSIVNGSKRLEGL